MPRELPILFEDTDVPKGYIFSNKDVSSKVLEDAYLQYETSGVAPKGFTVLSAKGGEALQASFLRGFQKVTKPITSVLKNADEGLLALSNMAAQALAPEKFAKHGPTKELPFPLGGILAKQIETPENAGLTAGAIGAGIATGGMSGALPALLRAGGAVGGQLLGKAAGGTIQQEPLESTIGDALISGGLSIVSEGVVAGFSKFMGQHLSQRAQSQISEDVINLLKRKYAHIAGQGPDAINAIASTPRGMDDLIQIGYKAIKGDVDLSSKTLVNNIQTMLPGKLTGGKLKGFANIVEQFTDAADDYLRSAGNTARVDKAATAMNKAVVDIGEYISQNMTGLKQNHAIQIHETLRNFADSVKSISQGAEVINALKHSVGPKTGFSVEAFQDYVANRTGSPLFEQAARAAGRGVRPGAASRVGFDKERLPLQARLPIIGRFGPRIPIGGTSFAGTVRGTFPDIAPSVAAGTTVQINEDIKEYFNRK